MYGFQKAACKVILNLYIIEATAISLDGACPKHGWESLYTGVQYNLDDKPGGIDVAVEGGIWMPTRSDGMIYQNPTPELKGYFQTSLPGKCWFYTEVPVRLVETSPRAKFMVELFIISGHAFHKKASVFISYRGFFFENIRNSHEIAPGISLALSKTKQLNLFSGIGIGPGSPKFFVGAFLSMRLDKFADKSE